MRRKAVVSRWAPWAFLALPLALYLVWVVAPILQSMLFAFTKKDSIVTGVVWVGFHNFLRLSGDSQFWLSVKNNMLWLVFFVLVPVPLGLSVAVLFANEFPGANLYKTLFYLPMTLSFAVIATIWMWIYTPDYGALNTFLRVIGLKSWAVQWIGDKRYMTGALIAVGVWRQVPYVMILYLAGLKTVPVELVEASTIDGAGWLQRFRSVVLPMLAPATIVAITISIIDALRAFDIVYVMTNTKARAAEVLASYMFSSAFHYSDFGYGSAIAVVQFVITLCFIMVYVGNVLRGETER